MPFSPAVLPRLLVLAPFALSACVEGMPANPAAPRMEQDGTCFAYVTAEEGGKFALVSGKGDGSLQPMGEKTRPMTAAAVDAAFAREVKTMGIMPECLAVYAKGRAEAKPFVPAKAAAAPPAKGTAAPKP